jgi:hypothetical protein
MASISSKHSTPCVQMGVARVERIRRVEEAMQTMTWGDRGVDVE